MAPVARRAPAAAKGGRAMKPKPKEETWTRS